MSVVNSELDVQFNITRSFIRLIKGGKDIRKNALNKVKTPVIKQIQSSIRARAFDTGEFFASVDVRDIKFFSFDSLQFFTDVEHAKFTEFGTKFIQPPRAAFRKGFQESLPIINKIFLEETKKALT